MGMQMVLYTFFLKKKEGIWNNLILDNFSGWEYGKQTCFF